MLDHYNLVASTMVDHYHLEPNFILCCGLYNIPSSQTLGQVYFIYPTPHFKYNYLRQSHPHCLHP